MSNYLVTDAQLHAIAEKLRQKTGVSAGIQFYQAFIDEIDKLTDTRDATATPYDILDGRTAYARKSKLYGQIQIKQAEVLYPSVVDRALAAGQYLQGQQTIKAVQTMNLYADNIKAGTTVTVGDVVNIGRIARVTGTFTSDATATLSDIASGKTAYVNGQKLTGTANYRILPKDITVNMIASSYIELASGAYADISVPVSVPSGYIFMNGYVDSFTPSFSWVALKSLILNNGDSTIKVRLCNASNSTVYLYNGQKFGEIRMVFYKLIH